MMLESDKYLKKLPYIKDYKMFKAVRVALRLIFDQDKSMKAAIAIATTFDRVNKAQLKRYLDMVIPKGYMLKRARSKWAKDHPDETGKRFRTEKAIKELDLLFENSI